MLSIVFCCGCGTLFNLGLPSEPEPTWRREVNKNLLPYELKEEPSIMKYYGGVYFSAQVVHKEPFLTLPFLIFELPLSFTLDTITLPFVAWKKSQKRVWKKDILVAIAEKEQMIYKMPLKHQIEKGSVSVTYVKNEDKKKHNRKVWFLTERNSKLIGYHVVDNFLYITFPFLLEKGSEIRISFEEG